MAASASIRAARSGAVRLGGEGCELVAHAGEDARRAPRRRAAGRTSGTARCGPGRRRRGSAAGSRRRAGRARRGRPRRAGGAGPARRSSAGGSPWPAATSGAERCWARKTRKTASSSSGVRSRSVDAVVAQHPGELVAELLRAGRRARRRGSAGRCGSAPAGCARGSSVCRSSPAGRLRLSSAKSANSSSSAISLAERDRRPRRRARRAPRGSRRASAARRAGRRRSRGRIARQVARCRGRRARAARRPAGARVGQVEVDAVGRRPASAASSSSPVGSSRTSGAPVSTWLPDGDEQLPHARREGRRQHRLHLHRLEDEHRRAGGDLVARRAPGSRRRARARASAATPPSSRLTRWVTPSTSTRWTGPWVAVMRRCARPSTMMPAGVLVDAVERRRRRRARRRRSAMDTRKRCGAGAQHR